ncbi:MAG: zinc-ribbon domain-containing protein [Mariprofundaceae bacterium]
MQFIQCPQCDKKYGVNDKVSAAAGKKISCKACGKSFEIVILEQPKKVNQPTEESNKKAPQLSKSPIEQASTTQTKPTEKAIEKKTSEASQFQKDITAEPQARKKRPSRKATGQAEHLRSTAPKKLSPTSILGVIILAVSVYIFYTDRGDKIGQPFVQASPPQPTLEQKKNMPAVSLEQDDLEAQVESHDAVKVPSHENLSKACKEISAKQWMIDYTMVHGTPKGSEYVRLMDQSVNNTAGIRKECGDPYFVHEVLSTAMQGTPPDWLAASVNELAGWDKSAPRF